MGLTANRIQLMLEASINNEVDFSNTLLLGRQKIWLSKRQYRFLSKKYGISGVKTRDIDFTKRVYADNFLKNNFNIETLSVLDYSVYEGADIVHDMNEEIPINQEQKYDVIIDGGTLEHIFNFPVAITNCMKMLKTGGSIFIFSMANNHCGHGFYQFSPELFFRIFDTENGFITKSVTLVEHPFPGAELSTKVKCYSVRDPQKAKLRGTLLSGLPLGIMVHAVKLESKSIFTSSPLQSDYQAKWKKKKTHKRSNKINEKILNQSILVYRFKNYLRGWLQRYRFNIKNNKAMFQKWPG